jgi:hypothetical protein
MRLRRWLAPCIGVWLGGGINFAAEIQSIPSLPPTKTIAVIEPATDGQRTIGKLGSHGVEADYRRDRPGYVLAHLKNPLMLEPGLYRATFSLRRGNYPSRGLLIKTYGLFVLEIWDITAKQKLVQRELQISDFAKPNQYARRQVEFSMNGRDGHAIEPRVRWLGLANGEIEQIQIERYPDVDPAALEAKATRFNTLETAEHLENGFVVSRKMDGAADETGDATTYTGYWVASLAWKYAATKDEYTYQQLENGLATLHKAIKGTEDAPLLARYVAADGTPFPKIPSKDVYNAFFLAYAAAYPQISNTALRGQMKDDVDRIASRFLRDDLRVKAGSATCFGLTSYFTDEEIRGGIQKVLNDQRHLKKFVRALKMSKRIVPVGDLWPGMTRVIRALENRDAAKLMTLVLPTANGAFLILERIREVLREQYRKDLLPVRLPNPEYPGIRLSNDITDILHHFPVNDDGNRLEKLADMKVLASNALIALQIVKTAAVITGKHVYIDYYRENLYTQDALLQTALDWLGREDEITRLVAGNPTADTERRGYLGTLALLNLWEMEKNPAIKASYRDLIVRTREQYRNDDNPLMEELYCALGAKAAPTRMPEQLLRDLDLYPENRIGFGAAYWDKNGVEIANKMGGGESMKEYSADPLPVSLRPKDSFLWQRNARQLRGDSEKRYPPTDYLFAYWYARSHGIIAAPAAPDLVKY